MIQGCRNTFKTLIIYCGNIIVVNFYEMIKVLHVQSIWILSIKLLEKKKRYINIINVTIDHMLANPLIKGLCVKLFANK